MILFGEESGQLETMLEKVADFYEAEVDAKVRALTSLIEPVMIMFVGAIVSFIRDRHVPADLQPLRQHPLAEPTSSVPISRPTSTRRIA